MLLLIKHIIPHTGHVLHQNMKSATSIRGVGSLISGTEIVDQNGDLIGRPLPGCKVEILLRETELDMCEVDSRLFQQPITTEQAAALHEAISEDYAR